MQTNEQFNLALNILQNTGMNLFLTGKAGTGKTTFLKSLKHTLSKRMIVVAPTGIAAINADGVTIHSFFQLPFSPYIPGIKTQRKDFKNQFRKEKINIIRSLDLLVIDEISMLASSGKKEGIRFSHNKWIFFTVMSIITGAISGLYDKHLMGHLDVMIVRS